MNIVGMIEENELIQTYSSFAKILSTYYRYPIYTNTVVKSIIGKGRVEGVEVFNKNKNKTDIIKCDTVIVTGKFRPDASLIDDAHIERDQNSLGPVIDSSYMTTIPNIFAAGNVLRGANMHDICALEGISAAKNIIKAEKIKYENENDYIFIKVQYPIRFIVPQKIPKNAINANSNKIDTDYSVQVSQTLKKTKLEAWVGNSIIWSKSYLKLIANHRIKIPVKLFNWDRVGNSKEIYLKTK